MKNQEKLKKISDAFYLINSICCDFHDKEIARSEPQIQIAYEHLQICLKLLHSVPFLIGKDNTIKFESDDKNVYTFFDMSQIEREDSI